MNPIYLSVKDDVPPSGYWDQTLLSDILASIDLTGSDRQIFIIPGAYQSDEKSIERINKKINDYKKVLIFMTSDEEKKFNANLLSHPDKIVYAEYAAYGIPFPIGYAPHTRVLLQRFYEEGKERDLNWSFSGQVTHQRRHLMAETIKTVPGGVLYPSKGFAQGLSYEQYVKTLLDSRVVLCPPGPISQDSFRLYEALEAGCIPIVDDQSPLQSYSDHYIRAMLPDAPFPIFTKYNELPQLVDECVKNKDLANFVFAWWINMKYRLKNTIKGHLNLPQEDMAVIVPVSPIPSHPSLDIIDETIRSIRYHTNAPILVTIDGVRDEQEEDIPRYREFIKRFLWKCNYSYTDVLPVLFPEHKHQSGMMKEVVPQIGTKYILYVEQDTPFTTDPIEWEKIKEFLETDANVVRFHFETTIPEPHKHLMIGEPSNGFLKTRQWSQRPHIVKTGFYQVVMELFSDKTNCFIEDFVYGRLEGADWEKWRVYIYHPEGSIKRSYHLDGRAGGRKYDKQGEQIY